MNWKFSFEIPKWDEIYSMTINLYHKICKGNYMPNTIVGISRGGIIPARVMLDLLGIQKFERITVESYLGVSEPKETPKIIRTNFKIESTGSTLVIDDIADTGRSLNLVRDYLLKRGSKNIKMATIYCKPWCLLQPDYYEKETKKWVVFPWERKETVRWLIKNQQKKNLSLEQVKNMLFEGGMSKKLTERFIEEVMEEI